MLVGWLSEKHSYVWYSSDMVLIAHTIEELAYLVEVICMMMYGMAQVGCSDRLDAVTGYRWM
jgi:hypothetical protein